MNRLKNIGKKFVNGALKFWKDESGMGTVEVILIIVVHHDHHVSYPGALSGRQDRSSEDED